MVVEEFKSQDERLSKYACELSSLESDMKLMERDHKDQLGNREADIKRGKDKIEEQEGVIKKLEEENK